MRNEADILYDAEIAGVGHYPDVERLGRLLHILPDLVEGLGHRTIGEVLQRVLGQIVEAIARANGLPRRC